MKRIITLTEAGEHLGQKLVKLMPDCGLANKPMPFSESVRQWFSEGDALIMICATGIAVRTLAPVIQDKHQDPPVLVLDEAGQFVIPLLSGHEGGANELASQVAGLINATLVITTANPYLKPVYTVGMGCERDCSEEELQRLLNQCLDLAGIEIEQIESINSIDIKSDEVGLISMAGNIGKPFETFHKNDLLTVNDQLSTRSEYVFDTVGVYGVAESAALYAAGQLTECIGELLLTKQKSKRATCAIARSYPNGQNQQ